MPVHIGIHWPRESEARDCPKGDIKLAFCSGCGFISNVAFDPSRLEYSQEYDNSLHFSPFFQEYARSLALRLIETYDLHNKEIIEIGCGKGDFLALLCELGNNRGVGFDRSYESMRTSQEIADRVTFVEDFYSERYASYEGDLLCCRYVFEHVPNPTEFLAMVRSTIGSRVKTAVYFEVPNVSLILRDLSVWDIIYEHCSYFCPTALAKVFEKCGFVVRNLNEAYEGQFLGIEAFPRNGARDTEPRFSDDVTWMTNAVRAFSDVYRKRISAWQENLKEFEHSGKRVVLWGAGAKGVSFMNMLKIHDQIEYVVDINPNKQGKHVAGTGQEIISPEFLQDYRPDILIITNPIYMNEIKHQVHGLGVKPQFLGA